MVAQLVQKRTTDRPSSRSAQWLKLYFLAFFFAGFNIVTAVFFACLEKSRSGFLVSILRGFVLIVPLALLMSRLLGMDGVWLSAPVTEALTALTAVILLRWSRGKVQTAP